MFAALAAQHADRILVDDGRRQLSYAQALELGNRLITGLPRARALVLLKVGLDAESIAAYLALMAAGHVPLLIERTLAEPLAQGLTELYQPDAVIDPVAETPVQPTGYPQVALHHDLALLLTTSGSTGSPKLVRLSKAGVKASAESIAEYLGIGPDERPLLHLPMSYSYGLSIINSHMAAGARLCLTRHTVMEPGYWDDLRRFEATSIAGVPFHYTAIRRLGEARLDVPSLKTLTQAGGKLDPRIVAHFAAWADRTNRRFIVMYGQTEAGPRIAWLPPEMAASAPDAIGKSIPGLEIDLQDADGNKVPDGTEGQLVVRGPMVMMGYAMEAADLALGDVQGGILPTGDLGVRGPDGLLRITGRASRMLKIYGLRVNIDEVEQRLQSLGISSACFGKDDELRIAIEGEAEPDTVRQQVVTLFSLPPRGIVVRRVGEIPRASSGKVRLADLAAIWEQPQQEGPSGS